MIDNNSLKKKKIHWGSFFFKFPNFDTKFFSVQGDILS